MKTLKVLREMAAAHVAAPAIHRQIAISQTDRDIIAACVIAEAGGEGLRGMQAVMNVISNRAGGTPQSFKTTVLKKGQFVEFNNHSPLSVVAKAQKHPCYSQALYLVDLATKGKLPDITGGSKFFFDPKNMPGGKMPSWAAGKKMLAIGNHRFVRESLQG